MGFIIFDEENNSIYCGKMRNGSHVFSVFREKFTKIYRDPYSAYQNATKIAKETERKLVVTEI